jgi:hypothetical protein
MIFSSFWISISIQCLFHFYCVFHFAFFPCLQHGISIITNVFVKLYYEEMFGSWECSPLKL